MGTLTPEVLQLVEVAIGVVVLFGGLAVGISLMVDSIAEMLVL